MSLGSGGNRFPWLTSQGRNVLFIPSEKGTPGQDAREILKNQRSVGARDDLCGVALYPDRLLATSGVCREWAVLAVARKSGIPAGPEIGLDPRAP
jgi:hypothetical protein